MLVIAVLGGDVLDSTTLLVTERAEVVDASNEEAEELIRL